MRRILAKICLGWLAIAAAFFMSAPATLAAAPPCQCFCADASGAQDAGLLEPKACEEKCKSQKQDWVVCAAKASQYPSQNPRCFTQAQCTEMQTALQEKCTTEKNTGCARITTAWDDRQPKICPANMHYCYQATVADIGLGIEIGGAKSVQDFGDYINKVYIFLLSAAGTIAIVMIMIGGAQYVMSAGSGKAEEAKERIKNAVIGFVLLLGAYAILYTVNPALVNLEIPRMPLIKGIEYVSGSSCEDLKPFVEKGWIKITEPTAGKNGNEYCGTTAKVKIVEGQEQLVSDIPDVCEYRQCSDDNLTCLGLKDQAICTKCELMGPDGDQGIDSSASVCSKLTRTNKNNLVVDSGGNILKKHYCWFTHDADLFSGIDLSPEGACASMVIDCLKANGGKGIQTCSDYDVVEIRSAGITGTQPLEDINPGLIYPEEYTLENICTADPCRWHRTDQDKECVYVADSTIFIGWGQVNVIHDCRTK